MRKFFVTLFFVIIATGTSVQAHALTYTDRVAFSAALAGRATLFEDYESYALGNIANGQTLGDFTYSFAAASTQVGVFSDGAGGQALGGAPYEVFVGGNAVNLTYNGVVPLIAFGADFFYAPNFEPLPGNLYQLTILDGNGVGTTLGNLAGLDASGGSFFLGFIGNPGFEFTKVGLQSLTQLDADGNAYLTPAYQVDNLLYGAAPVPEPGTLALLFAGAVLLVPAVNKSRRS